MDQQDQVRQVQIEISVPSGVTAPVSVKETIGLYDFGVPVNVTPPPASQITDITAKITGAGSTGLPG